MNTARIDHKITYAIILILSMFASIAHSGRGGGGGFHGGGEDHRGDYNRGGDYNHGGYIHGGGYYSHGGYYNHGWVGPGVVVGVPIGGYVGPAYSNSCSIVQQCFSNGNCVQTQVCN